MTQTQIVPENLDPQELLRRILGWDGEWYLARYPDVAEGVRKGFILDPFHHYLSSGRREGRFTCASDEEDRGRSQKSLPGNVGPQKKLGKRSIPLDWPVTGEIGKTFLLKLVSGFFQTYMSGDVILDVGFKGANPYALPILPHAVGVDLDYPGYDGVRLPFG